MYKTTANDNHMTNEEKAKIIDEFLFNENARIVQHITIYLQQSGEDFRTNDEVVQIFMDMVDKMEMAQIELENKLDGRDSLQKYCSAWRRVPPISDYGSFFDDSEYVDDGEY